MVNLFLVTIENIKMSPDRVTFSSSGHKNNVIFMSKFSFKLLVIFINILGLTKIEL